MHTLFYIMTGITLGVSIMFSILLFFVGRSITNPAFRFQRVVFLVLSFFVAAYLAMELGFSKFNDNHHEVLSIGSLLMIYFLYESYFFSFTALFHADYHKQKSYLIMLNVNVLVIALLAWWNMSKGDIHSYFSLTEFAVGASRTNLHFSARLYLFVMLLVNIIFMAHLIYQIYRKYSHVVNELNINTYDNHEKRMSGYLMFWGVGIIILFVGQFYNSILFHIALRFLLLALMVATFAGHLKFRQAIIKYDIVDRKLKFKDLERNVEEWLQQEPFPLLQNNITMDDVADTLNISRNDLSSFLSDELGISFNGWLAEKRITRCEQLLLNTDMTLSEVAYECGYADLPTMSKAFKRKYGFPPSKFRVYKDAKKLMQMHEKPMK